MTDKEEIDNIEKENIEADAPVDPETETESETELEPETELETETETKEETNEISKEANKDTMEEVKEFHEKKEEIEKEKKEVKEKPKRTFDLSHLNTFKDKLVSEFGLEEKTNERKRTALKLNGKTIIRFIPRKRVWYAIKHFDHDMKRIMYYTVESEEEETKHYEFVKALVAKSKEITTEEA